MTTTEQLQAAVAELVNTGRSNGASHTVRAAVDYLNGESFATIAARHGYRTPGMARVAVQRYIAWVQRRTGLVQVAATSRTAPVLTRRFGVEIECVGAAPYQCAAALEPVLGYLPATSGYHSAQDFSVWRCTTDGSLRASRSRGYGTCEVVSPPLQGPEGFAQLRAVMVALVGIGCTVNASCGMHVHVDAQDLTLGTVADVTTLYADHQEVLDQVIQRGRRSAFGHRYCGHAGPVKDRAQVLKGDHAKDLKYQPGPGSLDPARMFVSRHHWSRYSNVNLLAYASYGTVEFRQHGGTVNHAKATAWVELVLALVAAAEAGEAAEAPSVSLADLLARLRPFGMTEASERHLLRRARAYGFNPTAPAVEPIVSNTVTN